MELDPVSKRNRRQIAAFNFLQEHARSRQSFSSMDLGKASGWSGSTVTTHIGKQLGDYLEKVDYRYSVKIEFRRVSLEGFLRHTTQKRGVYSQYIRVKYEQLVNYEFLLPLTREDRLRRALDDLFYSDTIALRVQEIGLDRLRDIVPRDDGITDEEYSKAVCAMVSDRFVGYSISHVNGRYRVGDLMSRAEAGEFLAQEGRYLIDEKTAVVRFIIKCNTSRSYYQHDIQSILVAINGEPTVDLNSDEVQQEIRLIRSLFFHLFAEAVVRTIDGEEEIWLLETGPTHRLYVWERTK